MRLLIVDDFPAVSEGLVRGVDWAAEGMDEVLTAQNAMEARSILTQTDVDIMLCDIEMPVENGLRLFEWMRTQGFETCCIFLTSHAEFQYAQQAVKLGAFDYIVQPAPYAEVRRVVRNAVAEVRRSKEKSQVYDMGEAFRQQSVTIAANVLRDFLYGARNIREIAQLEELGCMPVRGRPCYLVLIQIVRWYSLSDAWEGTLMAAALSNITEEIFAMSSCRSMTAYMGDSTFSLVLQELEGEDLGADAITRQLLYLNSVCEQYMKCSIASYLSEPVLLRGMTEEWTHLIAMRDDNVALRSGVFESGSELQEPRGRFHLPKIQHLGSLLQDGYPQAMEEEAFGLLDKMMEESILNANTLRHFYQDFLQMLYNTIKGSKDLLYELFNGPPALELYRNGMRSVDQMKALIHHVAVHYQTQPQAVEQKALVRQVAEYIDEHLESELRRDELAEHVHLNADYLTRIFKKEMGLTIKEYITRQKMREAQSLLRTTTLPVSFIAAKLGYYNFSHFSFSYKKLMGVTPLEERQPGETGQ